MRFRLPWQTKEDPVITMLDQVLDEMRQAREEHGEILNQLNELTRKAGGG